MMTPESYILIAAGVYALSTFAYFAARRSSYHRGKAEVYQEFADTFSALRRTVWIRNDRERQEIERKRHLMRLILCDPRFCDVLRDCLVDADAYWKREADPMSDSPFTTSQLVEITTGKPVEEESV